jgi:hypothetical protein
MRFSKHVTHEQFIQQVRDLAVHFASNVHSRVFANGHTTVPALDAEALSRVARAKLLYGRGHFGLRGVTQYGAWVNGSTDELIEVCAASEESWVQLAGTTIHELAHAAMGMGHGHNKAWKDACLALGLRRVHAAGTDYKLANFAPELRMALATMDKPADGEPALASALRGLMVQTTKARPCAAGIGVRGGKSRGVGSGSRLRKYVCDGYILTDVPGTVVPNRTPHGQIIRASTDSLDATCNVCGGKFILEG